MCPSGVNEASMVVGVAGSSKSPCLISRSVRSKWEIY